MLPITKQQTNVMMSANRVYYVIRHIVHNAKVTREKCARTHKRQCVAHSKPSHSYAMKRHLHNGPNNDHSAMIKNMENNHNNNNNWWFFTCLMAVSVYLSKS